MATKTITIMEDAYEMLARAKLPSESFSDAIRRTLKTEKNPIEFWGAWKGLGDNKEIKGIIKDGRKRDRERSEWIDKRFA